MRKTQGDKEPFQRYQLMPERSEDAENSGTWKYLYGYGRENEKACTKAHLLSATGSHTPILKTD